MRNKATFVLLLFIVISLLTCAGKQEIPIARYYDYDQNFPLEDSLRIVEETDRYVMYYVTYRSFHEAIVTGLLTIPKNTAKPSPAVIFVHGIGDHKQADYMKVGHQFMVDSGFVVLRIDIANHGDRKIHDYKYDFVDGYRYWTRDIIAQTVFDLRRAIDFLRARQEVDSERIGYFGISLGGVIGTVFCGIDTRIKVPVIALAGGGLHLVFKLKAFSDEAQIYFSIIDPLNFVEKISPRPLLMLNAEKDEIVPPVTTKLMYNKAGEPKKIIWYPAKHREVPQDELYREGMEWFKKYL